MVGIAYRLRVARWGLSTSSDPHEGVRRFFEFQRSADSTQISVAPTPHRVDERVVELYLIAVTGAITPVHFSCVGRAGTGRTGTAVAKWFIESQASMRMPSRFNMRIQPRITSCFRSEGLLISTAHTKGGTTATWRVFRAHPQYIQVRLPF